MNWVNKIIEETVKEVKSWPKELQRPEVRVSVAGSRSSPTEEATDSRPVK